MQDILDRGHCGLKKIDPCGSRALKPIVLSLWRHRASILEQGAGGLEALGEIAS
jgi:hypothetical protein